MRASAKENLIQLKDLVQIMGTEKYNKESKILSGGTIGQHIRHILEFYLLLVSGSFTGTINYDKRERDMRIETDPFFAEKVIERLLLGINTLDDDQIVEFEADYSSNGSSQNKIKSSVGREMAYCIEHSIHHQAIIKAGLIDLNCKDLVNEHFGLAYSTIRYRNNSCAQ
jgi:hypothetical protein